MKIRNLILASMIFAGAVYAGENSANKFTLDAKILRENIGKKTATLQGESEILSLTLKAVGEDNATKLEAVGCKISTHTKTIYFVKIPASKLDALAALPEVEVIDCTREMTLDMDLSKQAINAETVTALNSGTPDNIIAGEGVLVGVFDTGIDIFHPDFSDDNGIRLQYFWDMSRKGTEPPEGYDWGAEYTKDYLDNNIQNMSTVDGVGHGTHVTGTIAGGGIEDPAFRGIAYNADIISVKGVREDDQKSFSNADVIAGCQYIVSKAKELGKPVVINLSLGSTFASGHDGTDLEAQAINELAEPGVLFAIAAGNDGGEGYHAGTKMSVGKKVAMPIAPRNMKDEGIFAIAEYMNTSGFFSTGGDVWYDAGVIDSLSISFFKTANLTGGSEISVPDAKMSFSVKDKDFSNAMVRDASGSVISYVNLVQEREDPISHAGNSRIYIHNAGRSSINLRDYLVCISTTGKGEGYLDMWAGYAAYQEQYPLNLEDTEVLWGDYMQQVSSPGTADSAICVGAFTTKNKWVNEDGIEVDQYYNRIGGITYFSSRGPSRDRRILPVISAPGQTIFSTRSSTMN
ncbi:MAG: S8 family serine peptidase, partial [Candidatus Kapabacteria bacterium]|nr:S8 family serine peptidase [Candidatus Kapabacteria bacterium]